MKVPRHILERIVYEEFVRFVGQNLIEAPKKTNPVDDDPVEKEPDEPAIPDPEAAPEEPTGMPELGGEADPQEIPDDPDPADDELAQDAGLEEPVGGEIAQELQGKTIQSITADPDSKMMPGAQEIVLTFNEIPDALRILVTKTGRVKYFFKGLHNDLGTDAEGQAAQEDEYTQAPDDMGDVPAGDNIQTVDTPRPDRSEEDEDEEEIEI